MDKCLKGPVTGGSMEIFLPFLNVSAIFTLIHGFNEDYSSVFGPFWPIECGT